MLRFTIEAPRHSQDTCIPAAASPSTLAWSHAGKTTVYSSWRCADATIWFRPLSCNNTGSSL